jgi:hypothetical protein
MKTSILTRLITGFSLAILFGMVTFVVGQAQGDPAQEALTTECADCHEGIQTQWTESQHGQATEDAVFVQMWTERGQPPECLSCHTTGYDAITHNYEAAGITCDNCHTLTTNGPSHPEQVMTTDYSAAACGTCHVDTYAEWQVSEHGAAEMSCYNCHNAHSTSIKGESVQALCQSCHTTEGHFYDYTAHAEKGLLCTDCHLHVSDGVMGDGHGKREHTFAVDLHTCNQCHGAEMHAPTNMSAFNGDGSNHAAGLPSSAQGLTVRSTPQPTSYLNFALLAGFIGLAFGAVGSPWVERGLRAVFSGAR